MTQFDQLDMAHGTAWMILFRFLERSLGLICTLILVCLLASADFGIMAMAFSFVAAAQLLTVFGFDIALIQRQDATEEHYHSAWTCNLLARIGQWGSHTGVLTASVLSTPIYPYQAGSCIGVGAGTFVAAATRPVIASLAIALAVYAALPEYSDAQSTFTAAAWLIGGVATGAAAYAASILAIWFLLSRPDGAERVLFEKISWRVRDRLGSGLPPA